jgi:hypothetical protein
VAQIFGQDSAQVPRPEDEHPIGQFGAQGADPPLRVSIRTRATRRGPDNLDASTSEDLVEGIGEPTAATAQQELELPRALTEVHQKVAGGLRGPRPVRGR